NLLEQELPSGQHLIFCRNVVIYFSAETKIMLYEKFYKSLADGGFLMVGTTEQIFEYSRIGFEQAGPFLYRKPSGRVLSK
ncbi:MAG TPA: CheR family methyltransferase, partial [Synergistales bacterium]|nr:CheR family methyltransferase [Synergistales bacterium]